MKKELDAFKNQLNQEIVNAIKNKENQWKKEPIDTGNMLRTTRLASVTVDIQTMQISVNINTPEYEKYVSQGLGSNRKYGKRDVIQWALDSPRMTEFGTNLYIAMAEERGKLDLDDVSKVTIKV